MKECVLLQIRILGADHPEALSSRKTLLVWQIENLEIGA